MSNSVIQVKITHNKVFVLQGSSSDISLLSQELKIKFFRKKGTEYVYEKTVDLWDKNERSFPTGYMERLADKLDKHHIDIEFEDTRIYRTHTINLPNRTFRELRENQVAARAAIKEIPVGHINGMTGTGKGLQIETTIHDKQVYTLVTVPSQAIRDQIYNSLSSAYGTANVCKELKNNGFSLKEEKKLTAFAKRKANFIQLKEDHVDVSPEDLYLEDKGYKKIGDEHKKVRKANSSNPNKDFPKIVVICNESISSLPIEYIEMVEMILVDEGHRGSQESDRDLLLRAKNAMYRYPFSATNWRDRKGDMELFVSAFGMEIAFEELPVESIKEGRVKSINYNQKSAPTPKAFLRDVSNPDDVIKRCVVGNASRNELIVQDTRDLLADGRTVLICVTEAYHCDILKERFREVGIEAIDYHSKLGNTEKREKVELAKEQKKNRVFIATMALTIGVDTTGINAIILADTRKSSINLFQRIGRGSRLEDGVSDLIIIDYFDWFNKVTMAWSIERKKLVEAYYSGKESFSVKMAKKHGIKLRGFQNGEQ